MRNVRVRVMQWFRTNRTFCGRLALLALAVQFVVSFGHIHREDIFGSARAAPSIAVPVADAGQQAPNHPAKHDDDYCAICATISLLGYSVVAAAPALPAPAVAHVIAHVDRVVVIAAVPRRAAFRSRAPPTA
jgi:hypothetical protein